MWYLLASLRNLKNKINMTKEEMLGKKPHTQHGLDFYYGEQTVHNVMQQYADQEVNKALNDAGMIPRIIESQSSSIKQLKREISGLKEAVESYGKIIDSL